MALVHEIAYGKFLVTLGQEFPHQDPDLLQRVGKRLYNYATEFTRLQAVEEVEGDLWEEEAARREHVQEMATQLAITLGMTLLVQPDPRGVCFKLRAPSGRTNDADGVGIIVPTGSVSFRHQGESERAKRLRGSRKGPSKEERKQQARRKRLLKREDRKLREGIE